MIERQAVIDKIKKRLFEAAFNNVGIKQNIDETLVDVAENRLKNWVDELPSVQPERKIGRWIPTAGGKGRHECSQCHEYAPCYQDGSEHLSTFCVLCGAKMESERKE